MTGRGQSRTITTISVAALVAASSISWAQQSDDPSGPRATLDLSAGASFDTNEGLDDPSLGDTTRTNVSATGSLLDETEVSRLSLSLLTRAEWANSPDPGIDGFDLRIPSGTLAYTREGPDSRLDLTGRYFYDRVDDDVVVFLDENLNPVDLIVDGGDLRRITLGADLSLGIESPIGFDGSLFFDNRDYIGTSDPDLYDRVAWGVDGALRFNLTSVMTGSLSASYGRRDEDDVGDPLTETLSYGAGLAYQIDEVTAVTAGLSYTTIEETIFDVTSTENDGWGFDIGAERELRDGTIGASLSRVVDESSTRTVISFERARELPDGRLSYQLGYSIADEDDDSENGFVGGIDYLRNLRTGTFTANATQEFRSDDDGDDTLVTRIALAYNQEINSVSSIGVNFGLGRSDEVGGSGDVTTRANAGVTYRHALTREWDWVLGYEARYLREESDDNATGNRVFTLIDRSFTLRP
jgi:hypothetical protein